MTDFARLIAFAALSDLAEFTRSERDREILLQHSRGASLRELADATGLTRQRVWQVIEKGTA